MLQVIRAALSRLSLARGAAKVVAICVIATSSPGSASESTGIIEDVFEAVNQSVVLVRTWESTVIARDGVALVPMTELGSGVLISRDGNVLTAAHLVQVADVINVEFLDGTKVGAKVIASEPTADLALLRLESVPDDAVVATMGDSDNVRVGQRVLVIGAPYGLSHTLSVGHISARHLPGTSGGPFGLGEFFQADAAVHRGNSGGPMFNMHGKVVGIVSHFLSRSGAFEGIGFAITSNSIKELLLAGRSPWSGISVFSLDSALAAVLNLPQDSGLLVQQVAEGSPGARLGLRAGYLPAKIGQHELLLGGDIILEVDEITVGSIESYRQLRQHLSELETGQTLSVRVLRNGQVMELSMVIEE